MATYDSRSHAGTLVPPSRWTCALLGVVMIAAGILALSDIVFATIISVKLIGLTAIAAGAFEIIHAISGVFGLFAGVLILLGFPTISAWALGFLLGVDLISHGFAWLVYALQSARRAA